MYKQITQQRYMTHMGTHIHIHHINITIPPLPYTSANPLGRPAGTDPSVWHTKEHL
jgi:hypothetical protein